MPTSTPEKHKNRDKDKDYEKIMSAQIKMDVGEDDEDEDMDNEFESDLQKFQQIEEAIAHQLVVSYNLYKAIKELKEKSSDEGYFNQIQETINKMNKFMNPVKQLQKLSTIIILTSIANLFLTIVILLFRN